ncbi:hypothetical protein [Hyperthermus butylicus]|uniref:Uncharacterized protein n=1 Tax=Hyperthermus butylicus (strain DSM 5456 / JCM 9403 / PLM1-5) TaxID=415426 RepID=A2BIW5_HYPBU|nr:hypothetical protein [Hyperthermus butylicus]ABM79926.1 hypothetical protein Hbut_0048 [Hyperthermus butylicus DSM 5456]
MSEEGLVDPHKLLRVLEDVATRHAKTVKALNRVLVRLRRDPYDEELQSLALTYIKRLRTLRSRLMGVLNGAVRLEDVTDEIRGNIATLSEYMIIVGAELERDLLKKSIVLGRRGARLLSNAEDEIRNDLQELDSIVEKLQDIVDRYY